MENSPLELKVNFTGKPPTQIKWLRDEVQVHPGLKVKIVTTQESSVLTIPKVTLKQGGVYKCVAKNDISEAVHEAKVTVQGQYIFIYSTPSNYALTNIQFKVIHLVIIYIQSESHNKVPNNVWTFTIRAPLLSGFPLYANQNTQS